VISTIAPHTPDIYWPVAGQSASGGQRLDHVSGDGAKKKRTNLDMAIVDVGDHNIGWVRHGENTWEKLESVLKGTFPITGARSEELEGQDPRDFDKLEEGRDHEP
jgi:hypothetical protein